MHKPSVSNVKVILASLTSANSSSINEQEKRGQRLWKFEEKMALEDTYPLPKPHKRRVSAYLRHAKECVTNFNGGGVNTHILTNVVEKATEVVKTPKELILGHKKCKQC